MLIWLGVAVVSFHLAFSVARCSVLILWFAAGLVYLCHFDWWQWTASPLRFAFWTGTAVGTAIYGPQLYFFWNIFSFGAVALWLVPASWIGLFVCLGAALVKTFGKIGSFLLPLIWCGFEYFRGELYYLKFSWLSLGSALSGFTAHSPLHQFGIYGIGLGLILIATSIGQMRNHWQLAVLIFATVLMGACLQLARASIVPQAGTKPPVHIVGIQLEFPGPAEIISALNEAFIRFPKAEVFALSEYTLDGPVPANLVRWCQSHRKYLVVGGKDPAPANDYFDTVFIVGPDGKMVFQQGKSVPIQFFHDGLPAKSQKLWQSPWGRIGVCVCYDLSYTRVTDQLVRMGAEALLVPTMDVIDWGNYQHQLHGRIARIRASEYRIPIFRIASSGISQWVLRSGELAASTSVPGQGEYLAADLHLAGPGTLPLDRKIAPVCVALTAGLLCLMIWKTTHSSVAPPRRTGLEISDFKSQI